MAEYIEYRWTRLGLKATTKPTCLPWPWEYFAGLMNASDAHEDVSPFTTLFRPTGHQPFTQPGTSCQYANVADVGAVLRPDYETLLKFDAGAKLMRANGTVMHVADGETYIQEITHKANFRVSVTQANGEVWAHFTYEDLSGRARDIYHKWSPEFDATAPMHYTRPVTRADNRTLVYARAFNVVNPLPATGAVVPAGAFPTCYLFPGIFPNASVMSGSSAVSVSWGLSETKAYCTAPP
ncbi:MAG: hypothetical protein JKY23_04235, partial [Nitrospinaceae bacterium]|nr:hypothetical protein [Nitrospinaceae bacterium]